MNNKKENTMKRLPILIAFIMILSGITILIPSENVSATSDNTWIADVPSSASVDASWENGTLTAGQNIWFVDAHDGNCSWNVAGSFGNFSLKTGYAGTVTQGASFEVTSYYQIAGTFTPSSNYILTDSGNFIYAGGTCANNFLKLILSNPCVLSIYQNLWTYSLTINANTQRIGAGTQLAIFRTFIIATGTTFTNSNSLIFNQQNVLSTMLNDGIITGNGTFSFPAWGFNNNIHLGIINIPVNLYLQNGATTSYTLTFIGNAILGSTLDISSSDTIDSLTVDLSSNNYALSATNITIGTRGILNARASQITASGNWDSSAGTFTAGTSTVHLTGTSKTLKIAGTRFNNLVIESGATIQLLSNVKTNYLWNNGTLDLNGFTMTVNYDQAPSITSSAVVLCHFIDNYYYNITSTDQENIGMTYGLTTTWPDAAINTTTGKITNIQPLANGTWSMNVSVSDGNHTVYQAFNLNIWNYAPTFTTYAGYVLQLYDNYFYFANATDSEGYSITFNCTVEGTWLIWNPTNHSLSGQAFEREIGYYDVSISAWDGYKTTWQNFTIKVEGPLTSMLPSFIIYFVFQIVLLALGLIGWFKLPFLLIIETLGTVASVVPTMIAFHDYWIIALMLIITNFSLPIMYDRKR